jgi:hypothetical protein
MGRCAPVAPDYRWRPIAVDLDDDVITDTMINGGADLQILV